MRGGPGAGDPTRVAIQNYNILMLVTRAYDLKFFQVAGADVNDPARFNITANVPQGATKEDLRLMLQNLLADRFKLKFHRETREVPVFELVVGKNGSKLKESAGPAPDYGDPATKLPSPKVDRDGNPLPPPGVIAFRTVNGSPQAAFNAAAESMKDFAAMLASSLGRPVLDKTGLPGKYDFLLSWASEPPKGPIPAASDDSGPTMVTAVQEQLGLKLESRKAAVELLVVDHYEKKPTEN
jgi:uncharacterized protein (TIGR03435 family)